VTLPKEQKNAAKYPKTSGEEVKDLQKREKRAFVNLYKEVK